MVNGGFTQPLELDRGSKSPSKTGPYIQVNRQELELLNL